MKVLLLTQYFAPEIGATQNRMAEFAAALVDAGHDVEVLTEIPNHPSGIVAAGYRNGWIHRERSDSYRVTRVWVFARPYKTLMTRLGFYATYFLMALVACGNPRRRYDLIAATTPPLTVAAAGLLLARLKRVPFVADVRDLWPEAAAALGELSNPLVYRAAARLARAVYRGASAVTATTQPFCRHIESNGGPSGRIVHVPNGTRPDLFVTNEQLREEFRRSHRLGDRFVVAYIGLHGLAQGLEVVLDAAGLCPETAFLLVGEGPRKDELMAACRARGCTNVIFLSEVPVAEVRCVMSGADALLVSLSPDPVFATFIPSKLFDGMAAARPIILMVDGEARRVLDEAQSGVFVPPGDGRGLAGAVASLRADPAMRARMGHAGRAFVTTHYDRRAQAATFARLVTSTGQGSN